MALAVAIGFLLFAGVVTLATGFEEEVGGAAGVSRSGDRLSSPGSRTPGAASTTSTTTVFIAAAGGRSPVTVRQTGSDNQAGRPAGSAGSRSPGTVPQPQPGAGSGDADDTAPDGGEDRVVAGQSSIGGRTPREPDVSRAPLPERSGGIVQRNE